MTEHHDHRPSPATRWLAAGGEMGRYISQKDWSKTAIGPIESWPDSLHTTVSICLASNFPIAIAWGPERTQIYNDGYWPICGDKHPESMGQDFKECWASAWPAIGTTFERAAEGTTGFLVNERMFLDRNGYLEETFFTFSFSPIRDETGEVVGLFHPVTEMTQQSLGERRLNVIRDLADRTSAERSVTTAFESIARVLGEHDLDVPFALLYQVDTEAGRARLVGSSGLEAAGPMSPAEVPLDPAPDGWPIADVLRDGSPLEVEGLSDRFGPVPCGPYEEQPSAAMVMPIKLAGLDEPFAVLVAGVSARRALDEAYRTFYSMLTETVKNTLTNARAYEEERARREALAALDRAKTAFFSNISHEFRTPLTLILGPLDEALRDASLSPSVHERLDVASRNAHRMRKLVDTLLEFSRSESGHDRASYAPTDLSAATTDLVSLFRSAAEVAGIALEVRCDTLREPVYVDVDQWERIILNLLSNAFKYTLEGRITVEVRDRDEGVVVAVTDTGIGMAPDVVAQAFDRFYRAATAHGRSAEGSGIGLALVGELVAAHGGSISVDSTPGRGSTFTITMRRGHSHLPAERVQDEPARASAAWGRAYVDEILGWLPGADADPADRPARTTRARILVVDDNNDMRAYLARLLSDRWDVLESPDGEHALATMRSERPDLVLSDVMMPRLDGIEMLERIRADPELMATPVILVSARAGQEAAGEGLSLGADDYLVKPFTAADLISRVEAGLNVAGRLQRAREQHAHEHQRSESLAATAEALADATDMSRLARTLLEGATTAALASYVAVGLLDQAAGEIVLTTAGAIDDASAPAAVPAGGSSVAAEAIRSRLPIVVEDLRAHAESERDRRPGTGEAGGPAAGAVIAVPILDTLRAPFGALVIGWQQPRSLTADVVGYVEAIAGMTARAVERIRAHQIEREIAVELQHQLLELDTRSDAAALAARYVAGVDAIEVGGDWYAAAGLAHDRLGIAVGDVVGKGLPAAAVMGRLRSALGMAALTSDNPSEVVDLLDRYARQVPDAAGTTAVYVLLDRDSGTIRYSCAGHLPPLVVEADGSTRFLDDARRPPLDTARAGYTAESGVDRLSPGSLLVLFTDGLIERRGESLDEGLERLRASARDLCAVPVVSVCDRLLGDLRPVGGFRDDAVVVAARAVGSTDTSFVAVVRADPSELYRLRQGFTRWLENLGLDEERVHDIRLAVGEALINGIDHGSARPTNMVSVEAFVHPTGELAVSVTDTGVWTEDQPVRTPTTGGRGLMLMRALMDEVEFHRSGAGTTVTLRCTLAESRVGGRDDR